MALSSQFCKRLNNILTTSVILVCAVLLIMETNLPNLKLSKTDLLFKVVNRLQLKNLENSSLVPADKTFLSAMESNAAAWFQKYFNMQKIDNLGLFEKFEARSKHVSKLLQPKFLQICIEILQRKTKLIERDSYVHWSSGLIDEGINKMNKSIPLMCSFLVGDFHNIFPSEELGLYFSIVIINTLKPQIDQATNRTIESLRNLTTDNSNDNLAEVIAINSAINQEIYRKLRSCKSSILYKPHECFDDTDFEVFSKTYLNMTFGIDYSKLDSFFFDRWTTFRIVGNYPVLEPTDITTDIIVEHFMFRGNIFISEESDMNEMRAMLQGVSLAKDFLKDRCSAVNMFTVRCRRKNIISVTLPCSADIRDAETIDSIQCTVPIIIIYEKDKARFQDTVFEKIGREINGTPLFTGKSYFWSFFEPQVPEILPF